MKLLSKRILPALAVALFSYGQCFGWGQKGHDTTCAIAENHLTKHAQKAINELLDGKSIVYWANWLDNASNTPEYAYSKTWHYRNIDAGQTWETAQLNEDGDVVVALNNEITILKNKYAPRGDRQLALKMIIHLIGDMHQPLHMGHKSDLGGNRVEVTFFKTPTNLHSAWDSQVLESGHKWSHTEWVEEIDRTTKEEQDSIMSGTIEDWAKETYLLCTKVYDATPEGTKISYDYVATWTPVIEQQLLKAGLRLASVLNDIFK